MNEQDVARYIQYGMVGLAAVFSILVVGLAAIVIEKLKDK